MPVLPPYDLSPLLSLLGLGTLIACLALFLTGLRQRQNTPAGRRMALTLVTLFLTFDLILVGSFTRLTDSGLGCPDWPGCYGQTSPLGAKEPIQAQQDQMPSGPVTHQKAWIEMLHRYLATGVGGLILVMFAVSSYTHFRNVRARVVASPGLSTKAIPVGPGVGWAVATLIWVCLQGAFGALTVTMKLFPAIVSLHLLGSYILLGMLTMQAVLWSRVVRADQVGVQAPTGPSDDVSRWGLLLCLGLVVTQACSGAWVSSNYAVLACQDFPACQGNWWPDMDFVGGFEFWRPLGLRADGSAISFQALTAIHFFHRLLASITAAGVLALLLHLRGRPGLIKPARWLLALLCMQLLTGIANVVMGWPLVGAMLHTAGAGGLVAVLVWMVAISGVGPATYRHKEVQ